MRFFKRERRTAKPLSDTSKRLAVRFTGTVQGVGFRWTCREIANGRGLTGWVRNELDGSVSLEIQGEAEDVAVFFTELAKSYESRRFSFGFTIDRKDEIPLIPGEADFAVVF
ncbi:acylphosphatase [Coriobacteriales bacterium OH1046]|nr:acylphosphatase [Coriobacteriales bacterium OH1046]